MTKTYEDFAGARIAEEIVCRRCLTMVEQVTAARGIIDKIYHEEVEKEEHTCDRCGKKMPT